MPSDISGTGTEIFKEKSEQAKILFSTQEKKQRWKRTRIDNGCYDGVLVSTSLLELYHMEYYTRYDLSRPCDDQHLKTNIIGTLMPSLRRRVFNELSHYSNRNELSARAYIDIVASTVVQAARARGKYPGQNRPCSVCDSRLHTSSSCAYGVKEQQRVAKNFRRRV